MSTRRLQDAHLNLPRFNLISRCFILWPSFTCARNFRIMPWGVLHHLSPAMHPHPHVSFFSAEKMHTDFNITIAGCAPLQPRGATVQSHCNGTLCGLRAHWRWLSQNFHMKMLLQCHIVENRRSYPDDYSSGLCRRSNGLAWGALYQISFWVEALHSFLTFTVGSVHPSSRPLGSMSALRPHQPLWKNPVHLTCIDWLHLCVLFGPCRWRRRAGQLPAAARRPIWCHPPASP